MYNVTLAIGVGYSAHYGVLYATLAGRDANLRGRRPRELSRSTSPGRRSRGAGRYVGREWGAAAQGRGGGGRESPADEAAAGCSTSPQTMPRGRERRGARLRAADEAALTATRDVPSRTRPRNCREGRPRARGRVGEGGKGACCQTQGRPDARQRVN